MINNNNITGWLAQGNNNTFILFDLIEKPEQYTQHFLQQAHRFLVDTLIRDDVLILMPHHIDKANQHLYIKMIVLEPDGSIAAFCGNGARVVAAYLKKHYGHIWQSFSLVSQDGLHALSYLQEGLYGVKMGITQYNPFESQFVSMPSRFRAAQDDIWFLPYVHENKIYTFYFTKTVEPHLICFDPMDNKTLIRIGKELNETGRDQFPLGINLNEVKIVSDQSIEVTTYERGVNRITQSCGTGSTSSVALSFLLKKITQEKCVVLSKDGRLDIYYDPITKQSLMVGPAKITENVSFDFKNNNQ